MPSNESVEKADFPDGSDLSLANSTPLLSFLLLMIAGGVHPHQLLVIEFLQAENRLLKEQLRGKRIRFTDAERALLGRKGLVILLVYIRVLSRKVVGRVERYRARPRRT